MKVSVSKKCHCIIKNHLEEDVEYDNKNDALKKANEILDRLSKETCKTHLFFITEEGDDIIINSKYNPNKSF